MQCHSPQLHWPLAIGGGARARVWGRGWTGHTPLKTPPILPRYDGSSIEPLSISPVQPVGFQVSMHGRGARD